MKMVFQLFDKILYIIFFISIPVCVIIFLCQCLIIIRNHNVRRMEITNHNTDLVENVADKPPSYKDVMQKENSELPNYNDL